MSREIKDSTPLWMSILIIVCMLPAAWIFPAIYRNIPPGGEGRFLVMLYLPYVLVAGFCAWLTYPQRKAVAWIILTLMVLCHAGIYYLMA